MYLNSILLIIAISITNYSTVKSTIKTNRNELKKSYQSSTNKAVILDNIRQKFTTNLTEEIIPHWYGTKWSFDGYSEIPKSGSIACGYFVSTTLRDMGININRYKLAQKAPYHEAKVIACGLPIETLQNKTKEDLRDYFLTHKKDGLYFIGLDFHVGYILKEKKQVYFIHSNYKNNLGPVKENINDTELLNSSVYHFCDISHNDVLLKKWLYNEEVSTK